MKKTLFQRLKTFINNTYDHNDNRIFTTHNMCNHVNEPFTNSTPWKRYSKNPNYTTHLYLGHLRKLGAVTRVKRGVYKINDPIPEWFGSFHFEGLKGKLEDKSNLYWNSLPAHQKANPWAVPDNVLRAKYPANVEGSIEQRISAMQDKLIEQLKEIKMIQESINELQILAAKATPEIRNTVKHQTTITTVEYNGKTYEVVNNINGDYYENVWYVRDLNENCYATSDVEELLIKFVKENEE